MQVEEGKVLDQEGGPKDRRSLEIKEQIIHINCLQMLIATLGINTFANNKPQVSILARIFTSTVVAYITIWTGMILMYF